MFVNGGWEMKKKDNGPQSEKKKRISAKSYLSDVKKTIQQAQNRIKNIQSATTSEETVVHDLESSRNFMDTVQQKAYELFERRGFQHGNDLFDWLEAERLIATTKGKASKKSKSRKILSSDEREDLIRQKAFEIYERRGCVPGNELFDWTEAQRIIDAEYS